MNRHQLLNCASAEMQTALNEYKFLVYEPADTTALIELLKEAL